MYPSDANNLIETQIVLGSKRYPETACGVGSGGIAEYWMRLQETVSNHISTLASSAIELSDFQGNSSIHGFNFQKILPESENSDYSGESLKMGDTISVRAKNVSTSVDQLYVTMAHDIILSVTESGCEIFD